MNPNDYHQCAGPGCRQTIHYSVLMCPAHWRLVPTEIQTEWRQFYSQLRAGKTGVRGLLDEAIKRAVESVK